MARLVYSSMTSLDGYIADAQGGFEWAAPDATVHQHVNDQLREIGTHLYGRRLYEVMSVWETTDFVDSPDPVARDFAAIWVEADKIVFSRTLDEVTTARTRIERELDAVAVRNLVAAAKQDVLIGGAALAGQALAAGIVDDIHHYVLPVVVGGGSRFLPDGVRLDLELVSEERFDSGVVHLHHRVV